MHRVYLNRVPGSEKAHVEFLPVDVAEVLADLKNAPALTARTRRLLEILEDTQKYFSKKED